MTPTTLHRISSSGDTIVCESSTDALCRSQSDCDPESWNQAGCSDHTPPHPVTPGHPCWMIEWVNADPLDYTGPDNYPPTAPGTPVTLHWEGEDAGVWWDVDPDHTPS